MADEHGYCVWSDLPVAACAHCVGADDSWMDDDGGQGAADG